MNSPAPGWLPDPTSRHEYRYWDGSRWTDDVADRGIASTDALDAGPSFAPDPNPTAADPTQRVDATHQYPGAGQQPPPTSPYYYGGDYGPGQASPPTRRRPPPGLIAALAVLAVALVGGLVYFLVRDDDGSNDDPTEVSDEGPTTTDADSQDEGGGSDTTDNDSSGSLPEDIDSENVDELVEFMADNLVQESGGALDHEQATCISRGLVDELGVERLVELGESGQDPFADPETISQLFGIIDDCGVSLEDLATSAD